LLLSQTEKANGFGVINASAATQNMLLAAHSLGIGSRWIGTVGILGTNKRADYHATELGLPKGYAPFFGVTLGYSASEDLQAQPRREGVVTFK
jgi:nitroreductase